MLSVDPVFQELLGRDVSERGVLPFAVVERFDVVEQVRLRRGPRFDFDRLPNLNRAAIHDLATCRFIDEKLAVLIAGPCGTGKCHLAQALGHAATRQGHDVLFTTQSQLLTSLRSVSAVGNYDRRFQYLAKIPLLIIDDFGLKPLRSPDDEDFHDLVAERYERVATILTSNLDFPEWGEAFPGNKTIGAATLDRLRHGAYKIILDADSYRGLKSGIEKSKSTVVKGGQITQSSPQFEPLISLFQVAPLRRKDPAPLCRKVTAVLVIRRFCD